MKGEKRKLQIGLTETEKVRQIERIKDSNINNQIKKERAK